MLSPVVRPPRLVTGERLSVEEFPRRWEELPELKNAELIPTHLAVARRPVREQGHATRITVEQFGPRMTWRVRERLAAAK
jgi:hypothetical protein